MFANNRSRWNELVLDTSFYTTVTIQLPMIRSGISSHLISKGCVTGDRPRAWLLQDFEMDKLLTNICLRTRDILRLSRLGHAHSAARTPKQTQKSVLHSTYTAQYARQCSHCSDRVENDRRSRCFKIECDAQACRTCGSLVTRDDQRANVLLVVDHVSGREYDEELEMALCGAGGQRGMH